jgi:uncharacterized protein YbjT (DUF2867 family)
MRPEEGTVLVTGATGFIGRRLVDSLLKEGFTVRCMVRKRTAQLPDRVEKITGDLLEPPSLRQVMSGIHTAFYLIHSMGAGTAGFAQRDRDAAGNFAAAASRAGIRRVIYLGGLGETTGNLSEHLTSRLEVAEILKKGSFSTTFLRAAVIIGAGGASFELIRSLVERLPVMLTPRWVLTRCQPIAVSDVTGYLLGCLKDERTAGEDFDIGGPEILTYREMMERFARIRGRHNTIVPLPLLTPKLSSYWVGLVTPVKPSIAMPLIEGVRNEVICRDQRIQALIPLNLMNYDQAVRMALAEIDAGKEKR